MRKLEINTEGSKKLVGMLAPGVIIASLRHKDANINFSIMINKAEKPMPSIKVLISRMDGQKDTYNKIVGHYYKKYDITDKSDYKEKRSVLGIMIKDISFDIKEISDLI